MGKRDSRGLGIIAVLGLTIAATSLGWQIYSFFLEQQQLHFEPEIRLASIGRVRVSVEGALVDDRMDLSIPIVLLIISSHEYLIEVTNCSFIPDKTDESNDILDRFERFDFSLIESISSVGPKGSATLSLILPVRLMWWRTPFEIAVEDTRIGQLQFTVIFHDAVTKKSITLLFESDVIAEGGGREGF